MSANLIFQFTSGEFLIWSLPYLVSNGCIILFLFLSLRHPPLATQESPRIFCISLLSANLPLLISLFGYLYPMGQRDFAWVRLGEMLHLAIFPFYLAGILALGKRLTIIPEANSLATQGIYRLSRHPLYVSYIYWALTQNLIFQTWFVLCISGLQIALLIIRAQYEEKILESSFPEYFAYKKQVFWVGRRFSQTE